MNLVELDQALRKLRLSGMADVLETRLLQAQAEQMAPIDLVAALVTDELQRRQDRLLARRHKQARFRDPERSLDGFDFAFNKKINRALVFELATARFVAQREDALLLGPPGTGKSHLAQAIGRAARSGCLPLPFGRELGGQGLANLAGGAARTARRAAGRWSPHRGGRRFEGLVMRPSPPSSPNFTTRAGRRRPRLQRARRTGREPWSLSSSDSRPAPAVRAPRSL